MTALEHELENGAHLLEATVDETGIDPASRASSARGCEPARPSRTPARPR
ncbi:hypothetical protein AB7C87_06655 [Natrarchaeobius sp. A-rgal3]